MCHPRKRIIRSIVLSSTAISQNVFAGYRCSEGDTKIITIIDDLLWFVLRRIYGGHNLRVAQMVDTYQTKQVTIMWMISEMALAIIIFTIGKSHRPQLKCIIKHFYYRCRTFSWMVYLLLYHQFRVSPMYFLLRPESVILVNYFCICLLVFVDNWERWHYTHAAMMLSESVNLECFMYGDRIFLHMGDMQINGVSDEQRALLWCVD